MKAKKEGRTIRLRLVQREDAEFIYSLRINDEYNKYLSSMLGTSKDQAMWIDSYKMRETEGLEYYFIIERLDNNIRIGTVRLYDFIGNKESFCWGSWILNRDKTRSSAIESAILVYEFAFKELNFHGCHFDVRKKNTNVIKFHRKFGAELISETDLDLYFQLSPVSYDDFFAKNKKFIEN
ncbi:GNAT family N-acetyltransferase [Psychromonas sp. Urea-02u-13]|uniref:GNAT family N-acetyltransferase n=1 Tax=Psychromonas sp. Urea-02u-13 TaxID=2058326 RepID=UPI000C33364F|nr:GNAT family N-acetyltransferase [Psychromonas sp. Urea-02u-13]PKG37961.1 N-acetyltransferase [Psychromonas sp. Urea-02u-13]